MKKWLTLLTLYSSFNALAIDANGLFNLCSSVGGSVVSETNITRFNGFTYFPESQVDIQVEGEWYKMAIGYEEDAHQENPELTITGSLSREVIYDIVKTSYLTGETVDVCIGSNANGESVFYGIELYSQP